MRASSLAAAEAGKLVCFLGDTRSVTRIAYYPLSRGCLALPFEVECACL